MAKAEAEVEILLPTMERGRIIVEALRPEVENPPADRSRAEVALKEGGRVILHISATDTSALRAALNSYLRWIGAITKALDLFEGLSGGVSRGDASGTGNINKGGGL